LEWETLDEWNIFICSLWCFWASSESRDESFRVRPRMKASGATSIIPFQKAFQLVGFTACPARRHTADAMLRVHFLLQRAGRKPSRSACFHCRPARMIRLHLFREQRRDCLGHGEIRFAGCRPGRWQNTMSCASSASMYSADWVPWGSPSSFAGEMVAQRGKGFAQAVVVCSLAAGAAPTSTSRGPRAALRARRWLYSSSTLTARRTCEESPSISRLLFHG